MVFNAYYTQTPIGILKINALEPCRKSYNDCIGVLMGLYTGSNVSRSSQGSGEGLGHCKMGVSETY